MGGWGEWVGTEEDEDDDDDYDAAAFFPPDDQGEHMTLSSEDECSSDDLGGPGPSWLGWVPWGRRHWRRLKDARTPDRERWDALQRCRDYFFEDGGPPDLVERASLLLRCISKFFFLSAPLTLPGGGQGGCEGHPLGRTVGFILADVLPNLRGTKTALRKLDHQAQDIVLSIRASSTRPATTTTTTTSIRSNTHMHSEAKSVGVYPCGPSGRAQNFSCDQQGRVSNEDAVAEGMEELAIELDRLHVGLPPTPTPKPPEFQGPLAGPFGSRKIMIPSSWLRVHGADDEC